MEHKDGRHCQPVVGLAKAAPRIPATSPPPSLQIKRRRARLRRCGFSFLPSPNAISLSVLIMDWKEQRRELCCFRFFLDVV
jgi:hypothetical protein